MNPQIGAAGSYAFEHEFRMPPPRPLVMRPGKLLGIILGGLVLLVFLGIALTVSFDGFNSLLALKVGRVVPGTVLDSYTTTSNRSHRTTYHLTYAYSVGRSVFNSSSTLEDPSFNSIPPNTAVSVQVSPLFPGTGSVLILGGEEQAQDANGAIVFALFWDGITVLLVFMLYVLPMRIRALVRGGSPAVGVITRKRKMQGKGTSYFLDYTFAPGSGPAHGQAWDGSPAAASSSQMKGSMLVQKRQWDELREGDEVTVLYLPAKPKRNVIYRFAAWQAVI